MTPLLAARVLSAIFAFRPCPACAPTTRSQRARDLVTLKARHMDENE